MAEIELDLFPEPEDEPEANADAATADASENCEPETNASGGQSYLRNPQRPSPSHYRRTVDLFGNPIYEGKRTRSKRRSEEPQPEQPRRENSKEYQPNFFDDLPSKPTSSRIPPSTPGHLQEDPHTHSTTTSNKLTEPKTSNATEAVE